MAHSPEDDPLNNEHLTSSEENLVHQTQTRSSNSKALKIAGLTTLACLLLSSQVFTAYMVFDQRQQIQGLRKASEKLSKDFLRSSQAKTPMKIQMPMKSLALDFSIAEAVANKQPEMQQQDAPVSRTKKQPTDVMQDANVPAFNASFLENMRSLKRRMNETEWKVFQIWMRDWLNSQRSQHEATPPPPQPDIPVTKTKCQTEASGKTGSLGSFRPRCDEEGRYHPMQCSYATGFCWCVDETGAMVEGSSSRDEITCGE